MTHGFTHVQVLNFGIPEAYYEHGSYEDLLEETGLSTERIVQKMLIHFSFHKKQLVENR